MLKKSNWKVKCGGEGLEGESELDYEAKQIGLRRKVVGVTSLLWGKTSLRSFQRSEYPKDFRPEVLSIQF